MKSGTTYLNRLLAAHPAIFMSSPKEPCRFVDPEVLRREWSWPWEQGYCRNEELYLSLFSTAGEATILVDEPVRREPLIGSAKKSRDGRLRNRNQNQDHF
jgi:hypothetical protein